MGWFRRKREAVSEPNPWLEIPHTHDPLPANNGKELVCGICGIRERVGNLRELK